MREGGNRDNLFLPENVLEVVSAVYCVCDFHLVLYCWFNGMKWATVYKRLGYCK